MQRATSDSRLDVQLALAKAEERAAGNRFTTDRELYAQLKAGRTVTKHRTKTPTTAYVNYGRWIADCECGGAELVAENEPMLCGSCGTETRVVFPDDAAVREQLLGKRPTRNQNAYPHETTDMLVAENIEHGIWDEL